MTDWTPVEVALPNVGAPCLVTMRGGRVCFARYMNYVPFGGVGQLGFIGRFIDSSDVIAWMPMPAPYVTPPAEGRPT